MPEWIIICGIEIVGSFVILFAIAPVLALAMAVVTAVFALLERKGVRVEGDEGLDSLPPVPKKRGAIPWGEPVADIVFAVLLAAFLLSAPDWLCCIWVEGQPQLQVRIGVLILQGLRKGPQQDPALLQVLRRHLRRHGAAAKVIVLRGCAGGQLDFHAGPSPHARANGSNVARPTLGGRRADGFSRLHRTFCDKSQAIAFISCQKNLFPLYRLSA